MEKLVQEEKPTEMPKASFEEICPEWNKIINENGGYDNINVTRKYDGRSIQNYGCCLVGEAHAHN